MDLFLESASCIFSEIVCLDPFFLVEVLRLFYSWPPTPFTDLFLGVDSPERTNFFLLLSGWSLWKAKVTSCSALSLDLDLERLWRDFIEPDLFRVLDLGRSGWLSLSSWSSLVSLSVFLYSCRAFSPYFYKYSLFFIYAIHYVFNWLKYLRSIP